VIGASNIFGKWGFNILGRLLSCRCDRQIYAINNKDPEVLGLKAYKGKLKQSYLEPYHTPEKAATVLAHLVRYGEYLGVARRK
jgi:acyl-CoA synthetase (NDP forming)